MTGVSVTAVTTPAVWLPSGAMTAFEVTEQEPPFLSQVAAAKSSECFAMFSSGPPMVWCGPQSTGPVKWSPARLAGT